MDTAVNLTEVSYVSLSDVKMGNGTSLNQYNSNFTSPGLPPEDPVNVIIMTIVLPVICACGILGIILTVIVLSRKNMSTSTNCYLMGLAIADLLYLVLFATTLACNSITISDPGYYVASSYSSYATIFMQIFLMASIWLTVMLAIERYIAICHPFMAAKMCTITRARIFIAVIFLFTFLCQLVNFWELKWVSLTSTLTNKTHIFTTHTELAFDPQYNQIYPWLVDVVLASILPFLLLLLLNARLIWEVRKSTHYMRRNLTVAGAANGIQKEELQITIMLISVIIVFFVCQAPYVIYTAAASLNDFSSSSSLMLFRYITMMLLTIKSAINFILYCWFSEKFWITLKRIFCLHQQCLKKGKSSQNGSYYNLRRNSNCTRDTTI